MGFKWFRRHVVCINTDFKRSGNSVIEGHSDRVLGLLINDVWDKFG